MTGEISVKRAAFSLGIVFAAWHLGWVLSILVLGTEFLNWMVGLYFLSLAIPITTFDIVTLIVGVAGAFLCGAVTGAIFAYVWNALKR